MRRLMGCLVWVSLALLTAGCAKATLLRLDEPLPPGGSSIPKPFTQLSARNCGGMTFGEGAVWIIAYPEGLLKIDPRTGQEAARIPIPGEPAGGLAVGEGAVWVTRTPGVFGGGGAVLRIDPTSLATVATIPVRPLARVAVGHGAAWVTDGFNVTRIDPLTNQVVIKIPVRYFSFSIATNREAVWVTDWQDASVTRIDPTTNAVVARIDTFRGYYARPFPPVPVAATDDGVWVGSGVDGHVLRIDPTTNRIVARIDAFPMGQGYRKWIWNIVAGPHRIWVTGRTGSGGYEQQLASIDPVTNEVLSRDELLRTPMYSGRNMALGADALWVC